MKKKGQRRNIYPVLGRYISYCVTKSTQILPNKRVFWNWYHKNIRVLDWKHVFNVRCTCFSTESRNSFKNTFRWQTLISYVSCTLNSPSTFLLQKSIVYIKSEPMISWGFFSSHKEKVRWWIKKYYFALQRTRPSVSVSTKLSARLRSLCIPVSVIYERILHLVCPEHLEDG